MIARQFAATLVILTASLPAEAQTPVRVDAAFLIKLGQAVNRQDVGALRAMTRSGIENDFRWATKGKSLVAPERAWQVKTLEISWISNPEARTFVNFTKYHPCESTGDHLYPVALTDSGPKLGSEIPETDTTGYRIRHHLLNVRFDVPNRRVHITDRIQVEQQQDRMPAAFLRLNSIYSASEVTRDGTPVDFRQAGGVLAVRPAEGSDAVYDLTYSARIGEGPEDYILENQAGLTAYWYAHTGRLPATHEVAITVPRGWSAIGQGELLGKNAGDAQTTYSYSNKVAVSYLTVAAGKYTVTTRKVGGVNVSVWLLRPDSERAESAITAAGQAIEWFSQNLSPYPYTTYAVVETDVFPAALECYSWTLCNAGYIPLAIVHEVAHTWWGGVVPNTYTRSLWNESFAEYSDGLYGRVTGRPGMHEFNARVMGAMIPMLKRATLATATDAMDMTESIIGYGKGSVVLENLERLLGREKMLQSMRRFITNHRSGEHAEWQDFIRAVTEVAGEEWAAFFPPWLDRPDLPKLRLTDVKAARSEGKYVITGRITQPAPAFWISAPIHVQSSAGSRNQWIQVKGSDVPFRVETAGSPTSVWLDPSRETLRAASEAPPGPNLLRLHTLSGNVLVVYATGGPKVEADAARRAAAASDSVIPTARLRIVPDTRATTNLLQSSNVVFIGKPQYLRVPEFWRAKLPMRYSDSAIVDTAVGITTRGTQLWGLSVQSHPSNPRLVLAHSASTSPKALSAFPKQEQLPATESRFIARSDGKLIAARRDSANSGEVAYVSP